MNNGIYIHETVDVVGHYKMKYVDHMCLYAPISRRERNMPLFGIWATVGSTTKWPTAVNIWEAVDGWTGLAANFAYETGGGKGYDQKLMDWMTEAVKYRSGGIDRILIPAPWSPTGDAAAANPSIVGAKLFLHETVRTAPGEARRVLDLFGSEWVPGARRLGLELAGAWRTAMADDSELILVWAVRDWPQWGAAEQAMDQDEAIRAWHRKMGSLIARRERYVMISGAQSPLLTGRPL